MVPHGVASSRPLPVLAHPRLERAAVGDAAWLDWRWQLRNMVTRADQLAERIALSDDERAGLDAAEGLFRVGLTPYYASLMDPARPSCPIRRQAIPSLRERDVVPGELGDPLGEDSHRPVPSIFHKYPDRVLLLAIDRCAIYCRHCNRRRLVGGDDPPTQGELEEALGYIAATPRVRDVLISGGDPLLMSTARLDALLGRLRAIPHVEIIRIGTRVPVVLPMRIDDALAQTLRRHGPVFVNTHFNHPVELTAEARAACERLVDHGVPVGNQTVLLRGINSSVRCLRALMRGLIRSRIRPYYLFQGDTVLGTDHLRTPTAEAIRLMDGLRGWMSGMAVPQLVLDAPGGLGKIPIGPDYVVGRERDADGDWLLLRNYRGEKVRYPEPRAHDCTVPYDEVYFADAPPDDDREGGEEG
jgi:lysine 2,3-aminomutase